MSIVSGYRIVIYEEYEDPRSYIAMFKGRIDPSRKLYDGTFNNKPDLAKIVALVEALPSNNGLEGQRRTDAK